MNEPTPQETKPDNRQTEHPPQPWGMEMKTFLTLMHLSQLAGFIIPMAGLVLPIVMWATNRHDHPEVDQHGKVILNWIFSALIYSIICFILTFVFIGILLFFVLGICSLIFAVIGAINAGDGKLWTYPLSIQFFRVDA